MNIYEHLFIYIKNTEKMYYCLTENKFTKIVHFPFLTQNSRRDREWEGEKDRKSRGERSDGGTGMWVVKNTRKNP